MVTMFVPSTSQPALSSTDGQRPGFHSFKTSAPIHYPHRWHRDALIQLTLDPSITALAPSPISSSDLAEGVTAAFTAVYGSVPVLLGLADGSTDDVFADVGDLPQLVLTRREVLAEPRATTARMIWSARKTQVSPGDRIRVLQRLSRHPSGLPISALEEAIASPHGDPIDAILALACVGLVAIDATGHLRPETVVRRLDRSLNVRLWPHGGLSAHQP